MATRYKSLNTGRSYSQPTRASEYRVWNSPKFFEQCVTGLVALTRRDAEHGRGFRRAIGLRKGLRIGTHTPSHPHTGPHHQIKSRYFIPKMQISKAEQSYLLTSLLSPSSQRADGRSALDYRHITIETGVAPQVHGSARATVGETEVVAAVRLEVEDHLSGEGKDGGRVACSVTWSVGFTSPLLHANI